MDTIAWIIIAASVLVIILGYIAVYKAITLSNYRNNRAVDSSLYDSTKNRIVNDQNGNTGKMFRYGFYRGRKNICEVIAVHNIKVFQGIESSLSEVVKQFQNQWLMIGLGGFGSNIFSLGTILKKSGIENKRIKKEEIENGLYIVVYWNSKRIFDGIHTVSLKCLNGVYYINNFHYNDKAYVCKKLPFYNRIIRVYRVKEKGL